jgi:hypothetical protein
LRTPAVIASCCRIASFDLVSEALGGVNGFLTLLRLFLVEPAEKQLGELVGLKTGFYVIANHLGTSLRRTYRAKGR